MWKTPNQSNPKPTVAVPSCINNVALVLIFPKGMSCTSWCELNEPRTIVDRRRRMSPYHKPPPKELQSDHEAEERRRVLHAQHIRHPNLFISWTTPLNQKLPLLTTVAEQALRDNGVHVKRHGGVIPRSSPDVGGKITSWQARREITDRTRDSQSSSQQKYNKTSSGDS